MAEATLAFEGTSEDGRHWYRIGSDPFDAPPFEGPDGRDWDAFRVNGSDATYSWRTGADREVARAKRLVERRLKAAEVARYVARSHFADLHFQAFIECREPEVDAGSELDPSRQAAVKQAFVAWVAGAFDELAEADGPFSYYDFEGDAHLADAAVVLPLPAWATLETEDDGGVGSGYDAPFIVLEAGRTLAGFAAWLEEQAAARVEADVVRGS